MIKGPSGESRIDTRSSEQVILHEKFLSDSIINSLPGIFYLYDEDGRFIRWNRNFEVVSGYTAQEIAGMHPLDFFDKSEREFVKEKITSVFKNGKDELEANFVTKEGRKFPFYFNGSLVDLEGRKHLIGMGIDIAVRKRAEEKELAAHHEKETTLNRINDAVVSLNSEWRYTFLNDAALTTHPLGREETMKRTMLEIHPELEDTVFWRMYQEAMRTGKMMELENYYAPMDVWFSVRAYPSRDGLTIFYTDISERKKSEAKIQRLNEDLERKVMERTTQLQHKIQQLSESEEKFQKTFQASAVGITITRLSDFTYLDVNGAFVEMTGYSREELIGHTAGELGLIASWKNRDQELKQVLEQGSIRQMEITARNKSGKMLEILTSVETITLNDEKFTINILHDITERKRAEEQLVMVNRELESFSYSVSHDLRAPVRSLIGYSKILEEDYMEKIDEEGKRLLGVIARNALKMNQLIDELLEFSKLGTKELERSEIDSTQLVTGILSEINNTQPHHATVRIGSLFPVYADKELLTQVWINLISNALKYSKGKVSPLIEIESRRENGEIVYIVKDNGAGFDMKFADKLFGVFQRLHKAKDFEGTGVGLSIVKRIITKHGGRVWAEAKVDEGAKFYFSLPVIGTF